MERLCHTDLHSKNDLRLYLRMKKQNVGGKNRKEEGKNRGQDLQDIKNYSNAKLMKTV